MPYTINRIIINLQRSVVAVNVQDHGRMVIARDGEFKITWTEQEVQDAIDAIVNPG